MSKKTYALNTGVGLFVDTETGLKVVPGKSVVIDQANAGQLTQLAIRNNALVEVAEKASAKKDNSDLPEGLPGREAFVAAGMSFEQVKSFDFENDKVPGVGKATIEAVQAYLKK